MTDSQQPQVLGVYQTNDGAIDIWGIDVHVGFAYLGAGFGGLEVIDVSDPTNPTFAGGFPFASGLRAMAVRYEALTDVVSVGVSFSQFVNFDVSDVGNIIDIGSVSTNSGNPFISRIAKASNGLTYMTQEATVAAVNNTDPTAPFVVNLTPFPRAADLAIRGNLCYVASDAPNETTGGLYVVDISNPNTPVQLGHVPALRSHGVAVDVAGRVYFVGQDPANLLLNTLFVLSVADPTQPEILSKITAPGAQKVFATGARAYVTTVNEGLLIAEVSLPGDLDNDGAVTMADVPHFIAALLGEPPQPGILEARADFTGDGLMNGADIPQFVDAVMSFIPTPTGACCTASACVEGVTQAECVFELDGIYRGNGSDCDVPCPVGACCSETDGSCTIRTEPACLSTGDTYLGEGTACEIDPPSCPFGQYSNTIDPMTEAAVAGSGLRLADDMTLAGIGARELTYMDLRVFGNGGGPFDVTIALYTDCPGDSGTQIPGTTFSFTNIPDDGFVHELVVDPVSPSVTIPDTVWMAALFSTPQSGWIIAEEAEVGSTENRYGRGLPWTCNNTFVDSYAGLWANLRCVEGGARSAAVGGSAINASQLRVIRVETEAPLELISPFGPQRGKEFELRTGRNEEKGSGNTKR